MSDTQGTPSAPAGWYADPAGSAALRWWDGVNWTDHLQATQPPAPQPQFAQQPHPYPTAPSAWSAAPSIPSSGPGTVAPGTPVYNAAIWVVTFLPLVSLLLLPLSLNELDQVLATSVTDPYALSPYAGYSAGGLAVQAIVTLAGWLIYGAGVFFAYRDHRWLVGHGYPQPFHWAWAFLGAVYPIGRSVVVRRRAGRGIAPMWASIAIIALSIIVTIVVVVAVLNAVFTAALTTTGSYT